MGHQLLVLWFGMGKAKGLYHTTSTSPVGPDAMTDESLWPNVSNRRRHRRSSQVEQSVLPIIALNIRLAELQ